MPRKPKPAPVYTLTGADQAFFARAEDTMHRIMDRINIAVDCIDPTATADRPDYSRPAPARLPYTFVPYGRELHHCSRALKLVIDLWPVLKSYAAHPAAAAPVPVEVELESPDPIPAPEPIPAEPIDLQPAAAAALAPPPGPIAIPSPSIPAHTAKSMATLQNNVTRLLNEAETLVPNFKSTPLSA